MTTDAERFAGTGRFLIESRLGAGGFGVVYRAFDAEREAHIALKVLRSSSAEALYRFKQEFRALADLAHPNLVVLYELVSTADQWFFTMELVEGVTFLEHLRVAASSVVHIADLSTHAALAPARHGRFGEPPPASPPTDYGHLRTVFRQLADGLNVLHAAGKLHCDVKPSNVLVTANGRVVILDFGMVTELAPLRLQPSADIAGTPAYMSPEQAAGASMTEASDWYSVGVMLYEALTGNHPFALGAGEAAGRSDPIPPSRLVPGTPPDLESLCLDLLRGDAAARPAGRDVQRRLAANPERDRARDVAVLPPVIPFIGRRAQLETLDEAFRAAAAGRSRTVLVHGGSGMGKTALVRRFLEEREREGDALVLDGRCYAREAVPYKALDSAIDVLSQHLKRRPLDRIHAVLPKNVGALARVFPVLRRIGPIASAAQRTEIPEPAEVRRRAFAALRELFGRLATEKPVVLFIDDLQWGDLDSARLLAELLRPPAAPPLLFIGCYRTEDADASPLLRTLFETWGPAEAPTVLAVGELPPSDARALVQAHLASSAADVDGVVRETGGSPFFIGELARHRSAGFTPGPGGATRLEDLIRSRIAQLPAEAQRLLETVAVAGRPIEAAVAVRAAYVGEAAQAAMVPLRIGRLIRTRGGRDQEEIETYHDRIRETVVAQLSAETKRTRHRLLAAALEAAGTPDADALCVHYQEAGDVVKAASYAAIAGDRAASALAFDRAARLFRLALELHPADVHTASALQAKLGDALSNAGRGREAAEAYLRAVELGAPANALELRRRAAEQLLRSGHVDQGVAVLRDVLAPLGLRLAPTPLHALAAFVLFGARVAWRGLAFERREAASLPEDRLIRIDTCWAVAMGLSFVDNIRGAEFQKRQLLLALDAGEPYRIARALASEAGYVATAGFSRRARAQALLDTATDVAAGVADPAAAGIVSFAQGVVAFQLGQWERARDWSARAAEILRERCTGVSWELDTANFYELLSMLFLGEIRELSRRLPVMVQEARERGDLYAETCFTVRIGALMALAADDPEQGRRMIEEALARWSQGAFHTQHYYALLAQGEVDLYADRGADAWNRARAMTPRLRRSLLLRIQSARIRWSELSARTALAAAGARPDKEALLREARRAARRIGREQTPWAVFATLLEAGVAAAAGDRSSALTDLARACAMLDAAGMKLHAAAARRRRGVLLGGAAGADLVAEADAWMIEQGVRNPERLTRMLAPGFDG